MIVRYINVHLIIIIIIIIKPECLFMLASDDVISVRIQTSSLFILKDGVKFNIWDVVSTAQFKFNNNVER